MNELKSCPFCGGKAEKRTFINSAGIYVYRVYCPQCQIGTMKHTSIKRACETWNTRYLIEYNVKMEDRWIPCSERLPNDFVWCLVCMSDGCIRLGKWNGEYDEQGAWWVSHPNSGGKLYRIKNVPFWMPLPEPPEKE